MSFNAADFITLVTSYGARSEQWPLDRREAAVQFAARHPTAQAILAQEKTLDDFLDELVAPPPSAALRASILSLAKKTPQAAREAQAPAAANDNRPWRWIGAGLAASLLAVFGLSFGLLSPAPELPSDHQLLASIEIEGMSADDIVDFSADFDLTIAPADDDAALIPDYSYLYAEEGSPG